MNTTEDQIAAELIESLFGGTIDETDRLINIDIAKAAIEKGIQSWLNGALDTSATHASEQEWPDVIGSCSKSPSEQCPKCDQLPAACKCEKLAHASEQEIEKLPGFWCWSQKGYPIFSGPRKEYEKSSNNHVNGLPDGCGCSYRRGRPTQRRHNDRASLCHTG